MQFIDRNDLIFVEKEGYSATIGRADFCQTHPDYSLPEGMSERVYDGSTHAVSNGVKVEVTEDISIAQLEAWIVQYVVPLNYYPAALTAPMESAAIAAVQFEQTPVEFGAADSIAMTEPAVPTDPLQPDHGSSQDSIAPTPAEPEPEPIAEPEPEPEPIAEAPKLPRKKRSTHAEAKA
jgi:hypothetical protein